MGLKRKINQYIDAGFPVLYINSFEDDKLDVMLKELGEGKDIVEWNAAKGLVDFETKTPQLVLSDDLSSVLNLFLDRDELERKIIVLKDIQKLAQHLHQKLVIETVFLLRKSNILGL